MQETNALFNDELSHDFLDDWDGSISTWEARVVRRFFSSEESEESLRTNTTTWAWLDDREYCTSQGRKYPNRMSATDLCSALTQKVLHKPTFYT
jgi:hypothetical protein